MNVVAEASVVRAPFARPAPKVMVWSTNGTPAIAYGFGASG